MRLVKNVAVISAFTVLCRISGMVREICVSFILGAGWITDAFFIALRLPNFFRQFFAEGAFNAAFVPEFSSTLNLEGEEEAKKLARNIFSYLTLAVIIFCTIFIVFMPELIYFIAPGFVKDPERLELCIYLVRITFPYLAFISLSALLSGILNSFNLFALGAAVPIIPNVFMITALLGHEWFNVLPVISLSWALTLSGIVQLIILYFAVCKFGYSNLLAIPKKTKKAVKILKLMIPGSISTGVMQINLFVEMMLASILPAGSLSYLFYADRLNQLPLALFGVSVGTALLPQLSKLWGANKRSEALELQETALLIAMQLTIPAAIALICLSKPLISILFGHGNFTQEDVAKTAPALAAFSIGLPAYVMSKIFTTTFFACENTKTPVKVAMINVALNILFTIALMGPFLHTGMALATSISAWVNVIVLGYILRKKNLFRFSLTLAKHLIKIILLSIVMGIVIYILSQINIFSGANLIKEIKNLFFVILCGFSFYMLAIYKLGFLDLLKR